MKEDSNYIYLLFFKSSTKIGKVIRKVTKYEYNHVGFSLNEDLKEIYSFARYYKNTPFSGGFVTESILRYKSDNTKIKIMKIPVKKKVYAELKEYIDYMKMHRFHYIYNTFAAAFYILNIKVNIKDSYTCIGFVESIFKKFDIVKYNKEDFSSIEKLDKSMKKHFYFEGTFDELHLHNNWGEDLYYKKRNAFLVLGLSIYHFTKLIFRSIL